jgi:ABC-2 type transport system ATP-binding protein
MTSPVLALNNIVKFYPGSHGLAMVNLAIEPGDIVGLVAGKTTLLKIALGLLKPDHGQAHVFGEAATQLSDASKARLSYVPQEHDVFGWLRGDELLALMRGMYPRWDERQAIDLCLRWGVRLAQKISAMSIGERQRLHIVRALASQPELLILDEPVASLDPAGRREFLREIVGRCAEFSSDSGRITPTVLFSSHIVSDLERCANKVAVLHKGVLILCAELDQIKERLLRVCAPNLPEPRAKLLPGFLHHKKFPGGQTQVLLMLPPEVSEVDAFKGVPGAVSAGIGLEDFLVELGM